MLFLSIRVTSCPALSGCSLRQWLQGCLALFVTASLLAGCGGGGTVPDPSLQARALSAEFTTRNAVNYAPYRGTSQDPSQITDAMVKEDLELLVAANLKLIRTFDSSDQVARRVLRVIRDNGLDIKVQLGVWIQSGQEAANLAEMDRGVALAKEFSSTVLAVSVGNETMVSWSFNPVKPVDMARYIKSVRDRITQPVTTNDNWAFWATAPTSVLDAVDYVAMHTYPLADSVYNPGAWDWRQASVPLSARAVAMMDAALARSKADYAAVRSHLGRLGLPSKPIVIGETGWKAVPSGGEDQRAHPVNQKMMFERLNTWVSQARAGGDGPRTIFWFAAFDEPWKGSDDKWGLFNVKREARFVIQDLVPDKPREQGSYMPEDAERYVALASDSTVTANRYTVYADAITAGEARPSVPVKTFGWNDPPTAFSGAGVTPDATFDVAVQNNFYEIGPAPAVWGWGLIFNLTNSAADLSNFATGRLNFSIKTTYPGKLEFGFFTGSTTDGTGYDVYIAVDPANNVYGYRNDGVWRQVSIPLADIVARGNRASCCKDSVTSVLNLSRVTSPFVIADRYVDTGKSQGTNDQTKILVDAIYWSK